MIAFICFDVEDKLEANTEQLQQKLMICPMNDPLWMQEKALQDYLQKYALKQEIYWLNTPIRIRLNLGTKTLSFSSYGYNLEMENLI